MNGRKVCGWLVVAIVASATLATVSARQDPLSAAKKLYESAEYDGALTALDQISVQGMTRDQVRDRGLYRALCLLALNRRQDAASTIERVVSDEPTFRLADESMPPRLRTLIEDTRVRIVPAIAQQRYLAGKKLFDSADYAKALEEFTLVMQLVDELGARANDSTLSDLKVLAGGFSDLAQRSIAPPKPSPAPESAPPKATPASNATVAPTPPATSSEISPPIVIAQQVPEYPPRLTALAVSAQMDGVVEVTIGADGLVKSVTVVKGIHPLYDELLIAAAKQWRYLPAMQNGRPVEFVKRLTVLVKVRPGRPGAPPLEPS